jgi:hypothetical protein
VPRGVYGPAFLLKAVVPIEPARLFESDLQAPKDAEKIYQVVIDTSKLDSSLSYDIFFISLGMITVIGETGAVLIR